MMLQSNVRTSHKHAAIPLRVWALLTVLVALPRVAAAVPSFATQTGLPCAQCHVMAFGPQLTEYGRQFKLNGYTFQKDGGLKIPLSATATVGYTSLDKEAPMPSPYSDKANLDLQQVSVYFAGRITDHLGAFVKASYDNIFEDTTWSTLDVRYARTVNFGSHSAVLGLDVNNNPTAQDLWNSTPVWGFPYNIGSELTVHPSAAPTLDQGLGLTVLGASLYSMIDNRWYVELGFYRGLSDKWIANVGLPGANPHIVGAAPYARIAWHQQTGPHYLQVGFVGLSVKQQPFQPSTTETDRSTDYGLDASYQFNVGTPQAFDAHASWIHEKRYLDASYAVGASDSTSNSLDTFQMDVSYIIDQTYATTAAVFNTNGSTNHLMFAPGPVFGSASGAPTSGGYTARFEWIPFGKFGSFASPWVNLRMGLQYTGYWRFNGGSSNYDGFGRKASDNNTLLLYAWLAL